MDECHHAASAQAQQVLRKVRAKDVYGVSAAPVRSDNSGKIENEEITYHDTREIFENGKVTGFTGNPRSLFELQNQKTHTAPWIFVAPFAANFRWSGV